MAGDGIRTRQVTKQHSSDVRVDDELVDEPNACVVDDDYGVIAAVGYVLDHFCHRLAAFTTTAYRERYIFLSDRVEAAKRGETYSHRYNRHAFLAYRRPRTRMH